MKSRPSRNASHNTKYFIDLFAGCGGLSLGLINAGWTGRFAIEKNCNAFRTLKTNLLKKTGQNFLWPEWLPSRALTTGHLLKKHTAKLKALRGMVDLIAGGPPCQGFSLAGRRIHTDPRNKLMEQYLELVRLIQPRILLVENVQGFDLPFRKNGHGWEKDTPYSKIISTKLDSIGYKVFSDFVDLSLFGVPQSRKRFILIAVKNGDEALSKLDNNSPFDILLKRRNKFLQSKGLRTKSPISAREAIFDLETATAKLQDNRECRINGFQQIAYLPPRYPSRFIALMRKGVQGPPDSLRLPRHRAATVRQFVRVMKTCPVGQTLNDKHRKRLSIKKQALTPLSSDSPSATITTLPDDIIHYSEPRILVVRENARLQTFPDWFGFTGNYTTGGKKRRTDCPRYTQVGNAVPPLFAEAIGTILKQLCC